VRGLSSKNVLHDVSLNLRAGEIVGLAGLLGSGRSELARALSGADPTDSGVVELSGEELNLRTPRRAFDAGIALVPEDRKEQGLVMELSVAHNMTLPHLRSLTLGGFVNTREESRITSSAISQLDIVTRSPRAIVNTLSGGNQQKTLFGKCLLREPKVLLLDEPTRGVDVGAKLRIYEFIHELAQRDIAILLVSSELEEIMGLAHRILVMRLGRLVAEFENRDLSMDQVMRAAFGFAAEDLTEGTVGS
jgi:ABC-type sugar transport system ATPase subunit